MMEYPLHKSFKLIFNDLVNADPDLADFLLESPRPCLIAAETAMCNITPYDKRHPIHMRITGLPPDISKIGIRELRHEHLGKFITIEGMIRKISEVRPRILTASFLCERCGEINRIRQFGDILAPPLECTTCHRNQGQTRFKILTELEPPDDPKDMIGNSANLSSLIDFQRVEIQEAPEGLRGGEQPKRLSLYCEDDLAGTLVPGDRVLINGVLRSKQITKGQGKSVLFNIYLQVNSVEHIGHEFEEINITPEEIKEIKRTSRRKTLRADIIKSICPSIYGLSLEKEAIALQLFGGVAKEMADGTKIRGDIHILLVGDPGTAKSQLLSYVSKLAPRGIYASGKASSGAGLTAAAVKTEDLGDGGWTLEAGALVLADQGLCAIDELDKMNPTDRDSMHTAMEQQQISIAKAGITATLQSRCSILAAANPILGRFDIHKLFPDQIKLDPPLLTRFDVIYAIWDAIDGETDRTLSTHITNIHILGEINCYEAAVGKHELSKDKSKIVEEPPFSPDFIQKYIAYAKIHIFPVMTQHIAKKITDTYVEMRQTTSGGSVPMTPRNIEAMIRLAEANARMHLRNTVKTEDVNVAIRVVKSFLERVAEVGGGIDTDILTTGYSASQRDRIWTLIEIIKDLGGGSQGASLDDIGRVASERGLPLDKLNEDIERLKRDGRIYEKDGGRIRVS